MTETSFDKAVNACLRWGVWSVPVAITLGALASFFVADPGERILAFFGVALVPPTFLIATFWVDIMCNPRRRRD